jgi:Protein of unknown function (DUF3014)
MIADPRPRHPEAGVSPRVLVAAAVILAVIGGAIWLWLGPAPDLPPSPVVNAPEVAPSPAVTAPVARPVAPSTPPGATSAAAARVSRLPPLDDSDAEITSALSELIGAQAFTQTLRPDDLVRRLVVTIDNLPRKTLSLERRAVQPVPGAFAVREADGQIYMSNDNFARYAAWTTLVSRVDAALLVGLYRGYFPLLQAAYLELGNPETDFAARVLEVIDHLLEAPEVGGSIALAQPNVLYEYADPDLESLSAGHKILVRMGPINAAIVKAKLREIRALLTR